MFRNHVLVCGGTGCTSNNSAKIAEEFENQLKAIDLDKDVQVIRTGCFGLCAVVQCVLRWYSYSNPFKTEWKCFFCTYYSRS